ncbi:ATP synthase subunit C [Thiohalophilus sp.]|uniref:ATP synthase subunit C n=1 Tax=Thiohalophilus sp. TaxID=3028392 RepID=UPI002ACE32F2|nr:ATP synthase subunit C [Thiohalophilus sp.]MDZ7804269.1 ATP synthase subunit C [Thiohalophilus sp.]
MLYWIVGLVSVSFVGIIALGIYYEMRPQPAAGQPRRRMRHVLGGNLFLFVLAQILLLFTVANEVMAAEAVNAVVNEVSLGKGLALVGIGLPTAVATIAAGIAVGPVGSASLAVIAEKPELFGRTLIYLGLAEGIAIYGLVVTILMLGKI